MVGASGVGPRRPMPTEAARPVSTRLHARCRRGCALSAAFATLRCLGAGMTKGRMGQGLAWVVRLQTVLGVWPGVSVAYPRGERHSSGLAGHVILLLIRAEGNGLG